MNGSRLKSGERYKGWLVSFSHNAPVTGKWRAERFGVGMCAGTAEQLQRMIDVKTEERRA